MSHTKQFLQKISVDLGYNGEINQTVIEKATTVLTDELDTTRLLTELYSKLKRTEREMKNE